MSSSHPEAHVSDDGIVLVWPPDPTGVTTGYHVYRRHESEERRLLEEPLSSSETAYLDATAVRGEAYAYIVAAAGAGGASEVRSAEVLVRFER